MSSSPADRVEHVVFLRPIGSPMGLGFVGLATATFVLAGLQLGWVSADERTLVGAVIIAFAVPLQLIAGVLCFLSRDGTAGTGVGTLAGSWLSVGVVLILSRPGTVSGALGLVLLASGTALILLAGLAGLSKLVPALVLLLAGTRFALDGIYQLGAGAGWQDASAAVGLALAAAALYAAWAMELEDARGETVAPLGRRGVGRRSLQGPVSDQVEGIEHEPGVRKTL
ncbi:MAG TPA: GPR1/FUN34/YaaH family transporter [Solirubrobacteraceae bacterium]|nr:GPR1/FUN34/YaaH family transporter [Solirubrobacteraceae bacterium]